MKDRFDQHLPRGNKVRGTKPTKKLGIIMVFLFCLFVGCHGKKAGKKVVTGLKAGEKKTLSIFTEDQNRMFYITVPASSIVKCYTTGPPVGDADLYAKFRSQPNTNSPIASRGGSNNEQVGPLKASKLARRLYVMVHAYTAFENVKLWCDLAPGLGASTPKPSSKPSGNPSENPSGNPSENPSENPSSNPTGCKAPGVEVNCPRGGLPAVRNTRLCCDGYCTRLGVHRCCLILDDPRCFENKDCCSGHCVNSICKARPGAATEAQLSIQDT